MNRRMARSCGISVVIGLLGGVLALGAVELVYSSFDPLVIPSTFTGAVLYQVKLSSTATRVVLALNAPDGSTSSRALHDDGTDGDRVGGDRVYSLSLTASELISLLRPDDVYRAEVGYVEVYDGTTLATRGNVFADVLTPDLPLFPVTVLASDVQRTDYLVNLVDPGFVRSSGFDFESVLQRFYDLFPDDFDFVNVVAVPGYFQNRFHFGVKSDVRGIGITPFDESWKYGSTGRLLGITLFPNPGFLDLAEPGFQHELGHQWINFLPFAPLNYVLPHWPLSDLAGGIMGFAETGYGQGLQFPCVVTPIPGGATLAQRFAPPTFTDLDLYLMGFLPADQVGSHVVFPRGTQSSDLLNLCGSGTWNGTLQVVTIADVVRQVGPRVPDSAHSPRSFRVATIIVSPEGLLSREVMAFYSYFVQRAEATREMAYHIGFAKGTSKPFALSTRGLGALSARISGTSGASGVYDTVGFTDILARYSAVSSAPIVGSLLAPGTVLFYITDARHVGKLEILESGYDLVIRFVTYGAGATVRASSERFVVPGTYLADLDTGTVTSTGADVQWSQQSETLRSLDPTNGALFAFWTP